MEQRSTGWPAQELRSGQCALCHALILPAAVTAGKPLNFGAIDPLCEAAMQHVAQDHAGEMNNILMAATLLTVYLATAFVVTDWPPWEAAREQMHKGLALIFSSADAQPAAGEDVAEGCVETPRANG